MAKALCDLVSIGRDYASNALFAALRYFVDSAEFKILSAIDSAKLVRLCFADETGIVRDAVQELCGQRVLTDYSALPFPKPDFPLTKESLPWVTHLFPTALSRHFRHRSYCF
jgi:hypothetical protein